ENCYSETPQHGIGSETPMHQAQTPLHPCMTPLRDRGGEPPIHSGIRTPCVIELGILMLLPVQQGIAGKTEILVHGNSSCTWGEKNHGSWETTPQAQGTPLARSNKGVVLVSPTTGSAWGSWGNQNPGSGGTSIQCQRGSPLARPNQSQEHCCCYWEVMNGDDGE
ncbi:hypothetical protein MKX03_031268, partial [Papaver bracteatum]